MQGLAFRMSQVGCTYKVTMLHTRQLFPFGRETRLRASSQANAVAFNLAQLQPDHARRTWPETGLHLQPEAPQQHSNR